MAKNNGGAAYPSTWRARSDHGRGEVQERHNSGMTLRDYFAAKAYAAMIAGGHWPLNSSREEQANMAYKHADAMLVAREEAK